ncbi:AAA family ATPase, partial [Candidatus Micrarchaeota archaeon]|nr:AAA family ATPase [Candidatus Micrarchaeota archaeon]
MAGAGHEVQNTLISIPGYNISQIIVRAGDYAYYRGMRIDKGLDVIIKTHVDPSPANYVIRGIQRELNLLKSHPLSFSLNPISIVKFPGRMALTFENWESPTLKEIMEKGELNLLSKLKIAGAIAEALQEIHERGLAHLRICPHNILADPDDYAVRILGFESAIDMADPSSNDPLRVLRGESARYAAPEQSGRMNMSPDHRSDLYALGICLFEIISGRTPFQSKDPLELTHFHMAETPETLESLIPDLPRPISKLAARLLSKNPGDRYQNALGVQEDLQNIAARIENSQDIYHIDLGVTDTLRDFRIPDGFYGREDLLESLTTQFDLCESEQRSICLLSGEAGVGKTTLALRLAKYAQSRNGRFIQSKFRQFDRNVPYSALIDAFGQMGRYMLSLSDSELALKREILRSALGANAGVITMALPELELIIGPQPPPQEIGPEEAQNRFLHAVSSFVRSLTSMERPLVIFIDDLHWADAGSLKLIETLSRDEELGSLMFMAAYRNEALTEDPALAAAIERIRAANKNVHEYHLEPLDFQDVLEMVSGVFVSDRDSLRQLAELIHGRSSGNPFFAKELLAMIHQYELAGFNKDKKMWTWDINAIK